MYFTALSSAFNCSKPLKHHAILRLSISPNLSSYNAYPNPFKNELNLDFDEKVYLAIYSLDGKLMLEENNIQNYKITNFQLVKGDVHS